MNRKYKFNRNRRHGLQIRASVREIKTIIVTVFLFTSFSLSAQEKDTKENFAYSNITEIGCFTSTHEYVSIEATTVNGFSIDKKHHFGIGLGIGKGDVVSFNFSPLYVPMFFNYRIYFNPEKKRSPHVNVSMGGLLVEDGGGMYSALTIGIKAGRFSFSSGLSFMAIYQKEYYLDYERYYTVPFTGKTKGWYFPFGITLKYGFTF